MKFGSVCSGIEAASMAWHPLGWQAAWFAEIEPFPSAVLAHHYPDTPNLGDMTAIASRVLTGEVEAPDMLCGGTPCQAFSVAGLRESLSDDRGNLTLKFVELADAIDHVRVRAGKPAAVVFWENVPGVLSTKDNAFGCFLAGLAGEDDPLQPPGGKWSNAGAVYGPQRAVAWRTLDAQYFGVAQRRRRVFVVASARNDFDPAAVLFEWDRLRRDIAPSRETREGVAATVIKGAAIGRKPEAGPQYGEHLSDGSVYTLNCVDQHADAFDTTQITSAANYSNPQPGDPCHPMAAGAHAPAIAFPANLSGTQCASTENLAPAMGAKNPTAVAVALRGREGGATAELGDEVQHCLRASGGGGDKPHVLTAMQVRRLTPTECERLQGFPDGYTQIPWRTYQEAKRKGASYEGLLNERGMTLRGPSIEECPDGPRYKALGNSWAVPNVAWIGRRIDAALKRSAA